MRADEMPTPGDAGGGHLEEGTVHAWLDGALDPQEAAAVEAHAAACEQCAALVAEARGLIAAASRILLALDDERSGVTEAADASVARVFAAARAADAGEEHSAGVPAAAGDVPAAGDPEPGVVPLAPRRRVQAWRWRVAAGVLIVAGGAALVLQDDDWRSTGAKMARERAASSASIAADSRGATSTRDGNPEASTPPGSVTTLAAPPSVAGQGAAAPSAPTVVRTPTPVPGTGSATEVRPEPEPLAAGVAGRGDVAKVAEVPPSAPAVSDAVRGEVSPAPRTTVAAAPPAPLAQAAGARAVAVPRRDTAAGEPGVPAAERMAAFTVGETRLFRGRVRSADSQEPIAGAMLYVPGAAAAVVTDTAGRFALPVAPDDSVVVVRRVGYVAERVELARVPERDSALVTLRPSVSRVSEATVSDVGADAPGPALLEAWLAEGASPDDPRVTGASGCWALVSGRVPGASEGVLLRLHGTTDGGRSWVPFDADSLVVRLSGGAELRLQRDGERLTGLSRTPRVGGTPAVPLEFMRVRCPSDS